MLVLTKKQRRALKQVYDRQLLWIFRGKVGETSDEVLFQQDWKFGYTPDHADDWWWEHPRLGKHRRCTADTIMQIRGCYRRMTYCEFRKSIQPGSGGAVMVRWAGMWLGIEPDGYIHS